MKALSFAVALLLTMYPSAFAQTSAAGTWRAVMDTPFKWEVVLREEGSTLTGIVNSCDTDGLVREILNGRSEGNTIRFTCRRGNDDGTFLFTGRLG